MELEYINELKNDTTIAPMIELNLDYGYRIRVVYRGEGLFYHDLRHNRAFICDIQIRNGSVFKKSIKSWDDKTPIDNIEEILYRICGYFKKYQKVEPTVR